MSASREKRTRQDLQSSGYVDPRIAEKQKKQAADRRSNTWITVGIIVFVLIAAALIAWNSGVFKRPVTALTADGEAYTVQDMNYHFFTAYSNFVNNYNDNLETFGLDTNTDLREQSCPFGEDTTWFDYFRNQAADNLAKSAALYHKAQKEGFEDKDAVKEALKDAWATIDQYAASNKTSRATTLQILFGSGMTGKIFERNVTMEAIVAAYSNQYLNSLEFTDEDYNAAYEKAPADYQAAAADYIYFTPETTEDGDEDAAAAAHDAIKEKAESAVNRYKAGETLEAIAADLGGTYETSTGLSNNTGAFSDWLFDAARQDGDIAAIDGETYYITALFHGVARNDFHAVSVRHILVEDEKTANDLLAQWEKGAKTEDSFAKLATDNSTDPGSSSNGGLYEGVIPGAMVAEFNDWCFDEARKAGDTGIVKTDYGYHVMYFVAKNALPYWQEQVQISLKNDAYQTWYTEQTKDAKWEQGEGFDSIWH